MTGGPEPDHGAATALVSLSVDPFSEAFLTDPYAYHAEIREAGPVVWLEPHRIFATARHAEVAAALHDFGTYSSARGVGLSDFAREPPWRPPSLLLETDPPLHDRVRTLMNRVVSPTVLKPLRSQWLDTARSLTRALARRGRFDGVIDLAERFPMAIFPDAVGLREDGRHHLLPYAAAVFNAFGPRNALYQSTADAAQEASAWVAESCLRDNLRPGGWGAAIYRAADEGSCTDEEAARLVRSLLSAGLDTTINSLGALIAAFAANPDQWRRLRADPTLRKKAFDEAIRWDSTVQTFFRTTRRDTRLGGVDIPEGSKILLFLGAANRDPRRWPDPDRFDIGRNTSGHVGFGYGIHQCLGQMVARAEADVLLEAMLEAIAEIELAGDPHRRLNNTLRSYASVPVRIVPAESA